MHAAFGRFYQFFRTCPGFHLVGWGGASAHKKCLAQKLARFGSLRWIHDPTALYNMRLERTFSIEWFPRYTLLITGKERLSARANL
jgi:hypothetical protein